jgi:hypothetical protein
MAQCLKQIKRRAVSQAGLSFRIGRFCRLKQLRGRKSKREDNGG